MLHKEVWMWYLFKMVVIFVKLLDVYENLGSIYKDFGWYEAIMKNWVKDGVIGLISEVVFCE